MTQPVGSSFCSSGNVPKNFLLLLVATAAGMWRTVVLLREEETRPLPPLPWRRRHLHRHPRRPHRKKHPPLPQAMLLWPMMAQGIAVSAVAKARGIETSRAAITTPTATLLVATAARGGRRLLACLLHRLSPPPPPPLLQAPADYSESNFVVERHVSASR